MHSWIRILLLAAGLLLVACQGAQPPEQVAGRFWQAAQQADGKTAHELAVAAERDYIGPDWPGVQEIARVEIDRVAGEGERARVPTRLYLRDAQGVVAAEAIELETLLAREDGLWRVRYRATMAQFAGAMAAYTLRQAGAALRRGIEETGAAMEEGLKAFSRGLEQAPADDPSAPAGAPPAGADGKPLIPEMEELQRQLEAVAEEMRRVSEEILRTEPGDGEPEAEQAPAEPEPEPEPAG